MIMTPIYLGSSSTSSGWATTPADGSGAGGAGGGWYDTDGKYSPTRGGHGCVQLAIITFNRSTKTDRVKVHDDSANTDRSICLVNKSITSNLKYDGTKIHISTNGFTNSTSFKDNTITVPISDSGNLKMGGDYKIISSINTGVLNSNLSFLTSKLASVNTKNTTTNIDFITQDSKDNTSYYIPYNISTKSFTASDSGSKTGYEYVSDAIVVIAVQAGGGGGGGADSTRGLFNWGSGGGGGGGGGAACYIADLRGRSCYLHYQAGAGGSPGKNSGSGSAGSTGSNSYVYISTSSNVNDTAARFADVVCGGGKGGGGGYDDDGGDGGKGGQCISSIPSNLLTKICIVDGGNGGNGSENNNGGKAGGKANATGDFSASFSNGTLMFKINITADNDWNDCNGGKTNGFKDSGGGGGATWYGHGGYSSKQTTSTSGGMGVSMLL